MNTPHLSPELRLIRVLSALAPAEASNRLMRRSDRELAISLLSMERENRERVLSFLGRVKRKRVEEELRYVERMGLRYADYRRAIEGVTAGIISGRGETLRSYIRPRRNGEKP